MKFYLKSIIISLLVKIFVSFFSYSGEGKSPMFGDYEAQRHWMEITFNLPISDWYFDTPDNNLTYWGLDYPPLTAYHSYLLGAIADKINPEFVKLNTSRGYESSSHKVFMRSTVIISDLLIYTLPILLFVNYGLNKIKLKSNYFKKSMMYVILLYPGLILIDNGHFQYNCVSLGFVAFSVICLLLDKNIFASIFYCLSLSYKQMSLYYSFPYFIYFLGKFIRDSERSLTYGLTNLIKIALSVIFTILISWFPFIIFPNQLFQVLHRIFPFYRGIFEDKVANFWCVANVMYKLKSIDNDRMAFICTIVVILATLVSCFDLLLYPDKDKFLLSLINSSLAFFLFSFQVHEKSILLVALPILFNFMLKPVHCSWFLFISTFSMIPLLIKDGLITPYIILTIIYTFFVYYYYNIFDKKTLIKELTDSKSIFLTLYYYFYLLSYMGCIVLGSLSLIIPPPKKYPHLFPLLISFYSACHFVYFLLFFNYNQLMTKNQNYGKKQS